MSATCMKNLKEKAQVFPFEPKKFVETFDAATY